MADKRYILHFSTCYICLSRLGLQPKYARLVTGYVKVVQSSLRNCKVSTKPLAVSRLSQIRVKILYYFRTIGILWVVLMFCQWTEVGWLYIIDPHLSQNPFDIYNEFIKKDGWMNVMHAIWLTMLYWLYATIVGSDVTKTYRESPLMWTWPAVLNKNSLSALN